MTRPLARKSLAAAAVLVGTTLLAACSSSGNSSASGDPPEKSARVQDKFFIAVGSGDPQRVIALMHPEMKAKVDAPVLADWMRTINETLGKYEGMSWTDWNTSWKVVNGVKRNEAKGTFNFAKGDAQAEFVYVDEQLVSFNVESKKMPKVWFHGPSDATLYQQRGAEFLRHVYDREFDKAYALTDQRFRDAVKQETLENAAAEMESLVGKVENVEFEEQQWLDEGGGRLAIYYRIEGDKQVDAVKSALYADVKFAYEPFKGLLMAFNNGATGTVPLPPVKAKAFEPLESRFVEALEAQDAAKLIAALDASLRDKVDEAVLAAWQASITANSGDFDKLTSIARRTSYDGGERSVGSEITCAHDNGAVVWQATFNSPSAEGATGFKVDPKHLEGWRGRLDASTYRNRGKEFLTKWLAGEDDDAVAMMGDSLREAATVEKLTAIRERVLGTMGAIKSIEAGTPEFVENEGLELVVPYKLEFENRETTGTVSYILTGASFTLNGFNVKLEED